MDSKLKFERIKLSRVDYKYRWKWKKKLCKKLFHRAKEKLKLFWRKAYLEPERFLWYCKLTWIWFLGLSGMCCCSDWRKIKTRWKNKGENHQKYQSWHDKKAQVDHLFLETDAKSVVNMTGSIHERSLCSFSSPGLRKKFRENEEKLRKICSDSDWKKNPYSS